MHNLVFFGSTAFFRPDVRAALWLILQHHNECWLDLLIEFFDEFKIEYPTSVSVLEWELFREAAEGCLTGLKPEVRDTVLKYVQTPCARSKAVIHGDSQYTADLALCAYVMESEICNKSSLPPAQYQVAILRVLFHEEDLTANGG